MGSNNDYEQELFDVPKDPKAEQGDKKIDFRQREYGSVSIKGRPNINEISKRNEEEEKQDRKSSYITTGIIILLIIVVMLLVYFFS